MDFIMDVIVVLKLCLKQLWTMFETIMVLLVDVVCEFCIETVYCICDCGLCVFCCELKGAEKSVLGGEPSIFVGLGGGRRKYPGNIFSSAISGPMKVSGMYFRRPHLADENSLGGVFSSVPTEIGAYFRRTYFRRLFSSVCRRK